MLLFAAATSIYCVATVAILPATEGLAFSMIVAVIPAIAYVAAGGMAIHLAEIVRRWSFADTYQPWNEELKFILGAVWPAVLVFWLTVGMFNHFAQPQEKVPS
jgi:hypothetical protein